MVRYFIVLFCCIKILNNSPLLDIVFSFPIYHTQLFWIFKFCSHFFKIFFLMWTIFKVFIEFITILLLFFYVLVFWTRGMWDLSSLTRDQTRTPSIGRRSLNRWTAREVPALIFNSRAPAFFLRILCNTLLLFLLCSMF